VDGYPRLQELPAWPGPVLHLLGEPSVVVAGHRVAVPRSAEALVVHVALGSRPVSRRAVASMLWPQADDHRSAGNLRSALWRLRAMPGPVVVATPTTLQLHPRVRVDVHALTAWANRVVRGKASDDDLDLTPEHLGGLDMLPGWFDDWALLERERLRQRTLNALEILSALLAACGRHGDAVEAALLAVTADPLRESAHRALIAVHLVHGNLADARRAYESYRVVAQRELGVEPSGGLKRLLGSSFTAAGFQTK
jgi:DNA-binding SARP family transcriptional activator